MTDTSPSYVVLTPVRDEALYLPYTIESVVSQTIRPTEWIIVDDGSTDGTARLIADATGRFGWIRAVRRNNRGYRKAGGGVVEAFYEAYRLLQCHDWHFMVKLDGDLSFAPDYFERCFERFHRSPDLGIAGGSIFHVISGQLVRERCPEFHVRGATKIYRRACWDAIGKLVAAPGWDTLDEVSARMSGWQTRTFPDLALTHHRYTGSAEGMWSGLVKNGRASYICGYHPLFMAVRCFARLLQQPYILGSIALAYGFTSGYAKNIPQVDDRRLVRYLRKQQLLRLLGRESIWR